MSGSEKDILQVISEVLYAPSHDESQLKYNEWAKSYDEDIEKMGGNPPQKAVESFTKHTKNLKVDSVLDLGAGTGAIGYHLRNDAKYEGALDIMDANMEMLYIASKKNLNLRNIFRHWVERELPVRDASYDVLFCVGSFISNHVPISSIPGMSKCVRKGGLLIFSTRVHSTEEYKSEFDDVLTNMERQGAIKRLDMIEFVHFANAEKKINSAVYVYEKL